MAHSTEKELQTGKWGHAPAAQHMLGCANIPPQTQALSLGRKGLKHGSEAWKLPSGWE